MPEPNAFQNFLLLLGRTGLSLLFIIAGLKKLLGFSATASAMSAMGLPFADVLLVLTIAIELGGGLLLLIGFKPRLAAGLIALFVIPVTLIYHPYWTFPAMEQGTQLTLFYKNFAIVGGLLYVVVFGAGRWALSRGPKRKSVLFR